MEGIRMSARVFPFNAVNPAAKAGKCAMMWIVNHGGMLKVETWLVTQRQATWVLAAGFERFI